MNLPIQAISPLRQRMLEDMALRKLSDKTQSAYIRAVRGFAGCLRRRPDTASAEDLRRYQLHMVETGVSPMSINATLTGLKFFFAVTADHADALVKMHPVRVPQRLPAVLSREEVARLLACAGNAKYQAALSVAYGAGLRVNEVVHLKIGDIDSQRMVLRVDQGKGHKDRYALLSPVLLETLRAWWRTAHAQGKLLDGGWLFPGMNRVNPLTRRFLLHVLPKGFHRIRHYGFMANADRKHHLAAVRAFFAPPDPTSPAAPEPAPMATASPAAGPVPATFVCPHCGTPMLVVAILPRQHPPRAPP